MNKFLRGLLSGASFAALNFGVFAGTARASGTHVAGSHASSVTIFGPHDFIWVDPGADVPGLTNHGDIGPHAGAANAALEINGVVTGEVLNWPAHHLRATGANWGIEVKTVTGNPASVGRGIVNSGYITVTDNVTAGSGGGVHVTGHAHATGFYNVGAVQINGSGGMGVSLNQTRADAVLPVVVNFSNLGTGYFKVSDVIHNVGAITTSLVRIARQQTVLFENALNSGAGGSAQAVMNNGAAVTLKASAVVTATKQADVSAEVGGFPHPAIRQDAGGFHAVAELQNNGTLRILSNVTARAGYLAQGEADIIGIAQNVRGRSVTAANTRNAVSAHLYEAGHGDIQVRAHASAKATGTHTSTSPVSALVHFPTSHLTGHVSSYNTPVGGHFTGTIPGSSSPGYITSGTFGGHPTMTTGGGTTFVPGIFTTHVTGSYSNPPVPGHFTPGGSITTYFGTTHVASVPGHSTPGLGTSHTTQTGTNTFHHGGVATAHAAVRDGILQKVSNAGHLTAKLTIGSSAALSISAVATARHTGAAASLHDGGAYAEAHIQGGIGQVAASGNIAKLTIQNNGHLKINIAASASAVTGPASAIAWQKHVAHGPSALIDQSANHVGKASEFLGNNGVMDITAAAEAVAGTGRAFAQASGGSRIQTGTSAGHATRHVAYNSGALGLNGIRQIASHVNTANLDIHNHLGTLNIEAVALALGGSSDVARAGIGTGIRQVAGASGTAINAHLAITNDGNMVIAARGIAAGSGDLVDGHAKIDYGIRQTAFASHAHASLHNAIAATATGFVAGKISILATAGGASTTVSSLRASKAKASAGISAGVLQNVGGAGTALVHNEGSLLIRAQAAAVARVSAHASAIMHTGIYQIAGSNSAGGLAELAKISNAGALTIRALASANAGSTAAATATIQHGIRQLARDSGHDDVARISNTAAGAIKIEAHAHGFFTFTGTAPGAHDASAVAQVRHGISQVGGSFLRPDQGTAVVTNHGHITITASAKASALHSAHATARAGFADTAFGGYVVASGYAISQKAKGTLDGFVQIDNSGDIQIKARASATATRPLLAQHAQAQASVLGIKQSAVGTGTAHAGIINHVGKTLTLSAHAVASGTNAYAKAVAGAFHHHASRVTQTSGPTGSTIHRHLTTSSGATANYAISQKADPPGHAGTALAKIDNSGSLRILGLAFAPAQHNATAIATVIGVRQRVTGQTASAKLTNHAGGVLTLSAVAHATGTHASAVANVGKLHVQNRHLTVTGAQSSSSITATITTRAPAISQHAIGGIGGRALAKIDNSGTLMLYGEAKAHGIHGANATATVVGIRQFADPIRIDGATAVFDNRGHFVAKALATAIAVGHTAASAHAGVSSALRQTASVGLHNDMTLNNAHGAFITISAKATARPVGTTVATARADAYLHDPLRQAASHFSTANIGLTNAGSIKLNVSAKATGTGNNVTALAYQKYSNRDSAAGTGAMLYQDGRSGPIVHETLNNPGTILIREYAQAHGSRNALAIAGGGVDRQSVASHIGLGGAQPALHGVLQTARSVQLADFHVTNSGVLGIAATASATGRNRARAEANIATGIAQFATQAVVTATLSVNNKASATLSFTAVATAIGALAVAEARLDHAIAQHASVTNSANLNIVNAGRLLVLASANASGGNGSAVARIRNAISQSASANPAQLHVSNSGTLNISAVAHAPGFVAHASANGATQDAHGPGAVAALDNSGTFAVKAIAQGGNNVQAVVHMVRQRVGGRSSAPASVSFANHHIFSGLASAVETAARISPAALISGVVQRMDTSGSGTGKALVQNDGVFAVKALASAHGNTSGGILAIALGVLQKASGTALQHLTVENSGRFNVTASVLNHGAGGSESIARAIGVAFSDDQAGNAVAKFSNTAHASVTVKAFANNGADAAVTALGLRARGQGSSYTHFTFGHGAGSNVHHTPADMELDVVNAGSLKVKATASGAGDLARATGIAYAVTNQTSGFRSTTTGGHGFGHHQQSHFQAAPLAGLVENHGNFLVAAKAVLGDAHALGIALTAQTLNASILNAGHLTAQATGKTATATGLRVRNSQIIFSSGAHNTSSSSSFFSNGTTSNTGAKIPAHIQNDGTLKVTAKAGAGAALAGGIVLKEAEFNGLLKNTGHITVAATGAQAAATAIRLSDNGTAVFNRYSSTSGSSTDHTGTSHTTGINSVAGTVENDGSIKVTAKAAGAVAKGIVIDATGFTGAIINKGSIAVEADGLGGQAVAIQVTDSPFPSGPGAISNIGGTISAKLVNGGVTTWGTAIDVSGAPGVVNIGLSGNGNIYGNVKLKSNSAITVSGSGVTFFSGIINPSKTKAGTITIAAGGNLELANDTAQGNAKAYVTSFSQLGTLSVDIGSVGNLTPYINAGAATLGGALVVVPGSVLPAANAVYRIVLSDAALATTWSGVSIKGAPALLSATATYLPNEADVSISVTAPAVVAETLGLTPNQLAILDPFEKSLANLLTTASIDPSSPLGKLVTALFTLTAPQLAGVLDQLGNLDAGAQTQNSLSFATALLDQILNHLGQGATGGGGFASLPNMPAGVRPAQLTTGAGTIWGGLYGAHASTKSVGGTPGSSTSLTGLYAGYDLALNTDILAGVAVAYSTDTTKTGSPGGHGSANGFQVSPYLRLTRDSGFFVNADVSYGIYNNKLTRTLTIPGFGSGTNTGKFTSNVFSAYAEAGQNFASGSLTISPYAALAYARGDSAAYTETGLAGTLLHVNSANAQTLTSYLGAGLSHVFDLDGGGTLTPRIRLAWAHDYSGSAWQVNAAFAALPGSGFAIRGPGLRRDKAYINAALDLHLSDEIETSLNYDALFNNDQSQQSLMGVLRFSF